MLSVRFEVSVSLLLAPARVEIAGIQLAIRKRVFPGAPVGAGAY